MATIRSISLGPLKPASKYQLSFRVVSAYNYHPHKLAAHLRTELTTDVIVKRTNDKELEITTHFDGIRTVEEHGEVVLAIITDLDKAVKDAKIQEDLLAMIDE